MFKLLKHRNKKSVPLDYDIEEESAPAPPVDDVDLASVDDLVQAMWNGFSRHAVADLEKLVRDEARSDRERSDAQYDLARWYAIQGDWRAAKEHLSDIKQYSQELYQSKQVELFLAEAAVQLSDKDGILKRIDAALTHRFDSDYLLAKANLGTETNHDDDGKKQLHILNSIYKQFGISQVSVSPECNRLKFDDLKPDNIKHDDDGFRFQGGPLISILMSVHNAEPYLSTAIQSILDQTYQRIEIIAVDDNSSDHSGDILSRFSNHDSRVKVYKNDEQLGMYPTRNRALDWATGDLITVHGAHEWSHPRKLEMQMGAMMSQPRYRAVFCSSASVTDHMRFILQLDAKQPGYIYRQDSAMLMRRKDFQQLKYWDDVLADADAELIHRAQLLWKDDFSQTVAPLAPLSLSVVPDESLKARSASRLNSAPISSVQEYARQGEHWRRSIQNAEETGIQRTSRKKPFPIPSDICPPIWRANSAYDLVIISDLSLPADTEHSNEGYIRAAIDNGLRVGLFHWPRYDYEPSPIADVFNELSCHNAVDFLVPDDSISARLLLIHHPHILRYEIDAVPKINAGKLAILVDQAPMELWEETPYFFDDDDVSKTCQKLFHLTPTWISTSPRIHRILLETGKFNNILSNPWYPPSPGELPETVPALPDNFGTDRPIVVGRYCRDHWTQWPADREELSAAYMVNKSNIVLRVMGGLNTPEKILGGRPSNWEEIDAGGDGNGLPLDAFIASLDFFIHFIHDDVIEAFAQRAVAAMARGRVVLLPPDFREIFEDAAVYCAPSEVENRINTYWEDPELYRAQAARGFAFVKNNCAKRVAFNHLAQIIDTPPQPGETHITPVS